MNPAPQPLFTRRERYVLGLCLVAALLLCLAGCGTRTESKNQETIQGQMRVQGQVAGQPVDILLQHQAQTIGETNSSTTLQPFASAFFSGAGQALGNALSTYVGGGGILGGLAAAALALWRKRQADAALRETVAATEAWKSDDTIPAGAKVALLDNLSRKMSGTSKQRVKRERQVVLT